MLVFVTKTKGNKKISLAPIMTNCIVDSCKHREKQKLRSFKLCKTVKFSHQQLHCDCSNRVKLYTRQHRYLVGFRNEIFCVCNSETINMV